MKKAAGLALAAATLWAALLVARPRSTRDADRPARDADTEVDPAPDEPSTPTASVAPTRLPAPATGAERATIPRADPVAPPASAPEAEAAPAPDYTELPTPNHSPEALRDRFEAERRDSTWADGQESRVNALLEAAGASDLVSGIECRSRVCRIELSGQISEDAAELAGIEGLRDETGVGPGTPFVVEGDKLAVYFVRRGFQLY